MYKSVLREKQKESKFSIFRLQNGLDKLEGANLAVKDMEVKLTELAPVLEQASIDT
jgi:hypothetical protein